MASGSTDPGIDPAPGANPPRGHLLRGSAWMIAMRWATRALGLVSTVILARLLAPEDFGVVAMAMVVVGFLEVFTHTGVDLALIRDANATREHYDTAWTLEILQAVALAVALLAAAPAATRYFDDARVLEVMQLLSLRALLGGFENIGVVAFRRDLNFNREFCFGVFKKMSTVAVTIVAAIVFRSYWALVIGLVGGRALDVVISFVMHPYRPRPTLARFSEIWGFSRWLLLARVANLANRKLDEFVVGGQAGTAAMGNYFVASDIATAPAEEVVLPMTRGIFPVYSRQQHDRVQLAESFFTVLRSTAYLCVALGLGVSAVAPELVPLVLGSQWLAAIPLMQWLGVWGALMGMALTLDPLLLATGRAALLSAFKWIQLAVLIPALIAGGMLAGVVGVAAAKTLVMAAVLPVFLFWAARAEGIGAWRVAGAVTPAAIAGLAMYGGVLGIAGVVHDQALWLRLLLEVATGALIYPAVVLIAWRLRGAPAGPEREVIEKLGRLLRRSPAQS
jgi:lipopolysaccharide exporter